MADHTTCPDGSMCVNGSVVACPANQRCINGTVLSCPENSFCANGTISGCPSNHTCKDGSVLCRAQVGATVRWNGTGCEYHVRSVNFMVRIASSVVHETTSDAKFVTVNRRYPPISCPVRDSWNMEIPSNIKPLQSAIQIDGGPWMAWSWRNNLLPSPVKTRVRLRVYYAGRIMEFVGRPSPRMAMLAVPAIPIAIRWGVGRGTIGDTQALCSVTAPHGMTLSLQSAAFPSLNQAMQWQGGASGPNARWDLNCKNMSDGVQWLAYNTEVEGMEPSFTGFSQEECRRGTSTWLMPQTDRPHAQFVAVRAVASEPVLGLH